MCHQREGRYSKRIYICIRETTGIIFRGRILFLQIEKRNDAERSFDRYILLITDLCVKRAESSAPLSVSLFIFPSFNAAIYCLPRTSHEIVSNSTGRNVIFFFSLSSIPLTKINFPWNRIHSRSNVSLQELNFHSYSFIDEQKNSKVRGIEIALFSQASP